MALSVSIVGAIRGEGEAWTRGAVARALEEACGSPVKLTSVARCDVAVVYPYLFDTLPFGRVRDDVILGLPKRLRLFDDPVEWALRRRGLPKGSQILFVSHENLDAPQWWAWKRWILSTQHPRLTFWPHALDPLGFRFPYWWCYVRWPRLKNTNSYDRYGRLYELETLLSPLRKPSSRVVRENRGVLLAQRLTFPRDGLMSTLQKRWTIDYVSKWQGKKIDLLQKYAAAVVTENSVGYGYETEKLPDAWVAGCIPIGYVPAPFCSFNAKLFGDETESYTAYEEPLLLEPPDIGSLILYLAKLSA